MTALLRAAAVAAAAACIVHATQNSTELTSWTLSLTTPLTAAELASLSPQEAALASALTAGLPVTAPCTVFACLMQSGAYSDIFYGSNLVQVNSSLFNRSYSYATSVVVPPSDAGVTWTLLFQGLNYRANVLLDGAALCDNGTCVGAFVYFALDATPGLSTPGAHSIVVQVYPEQDRSLPATNHDLDLGITFVDWSPSPPDASMGLWRKVLLRQAAAGVTLTDPVVDTLDLNVSTGDARCSVGVYVTNWRQQAVATCSLNASIIAPGGGLLARTSVQVDIPAGTEMNVTFPTVALTNASVWWPAQMGTPALHTLNVTVTCDGTGVVSDSLSTRFGVRTTSSSLNSAGNRAFAVNGVPLLLRGAGWTPDLFLRVNATILAAQMAYVAHMGLNTLRLEGKFEPDEFFEAADAAGILVIPGICCCDAWQHWQWWTQEQYNVSAASMRSQSRRIRIHPSALFFFISSDELPPQDVEAEYDVALAVTGWPNPIVSSAASVQSPISGPSGVKMSGPYSWVAPNYWLLDDGKYNLGGAWGFLTEGGPGEAPLTYESLAAVTPADALWPPAPDNCWGHCGSPEGNFGLLDRFNGPLYARYGVPTSVRTYLAYAHAAAYDGHRAMFEGYSRNKHVLSTGVIQWMLGNSWPENIWHLFEYNLTPGPTYFATKAACELLHVQYSYDNATVAVVNSAYTSVGALNVTADVLALNGTLVKRAAVTIAGVAADAAITVLDLPTAAAMRRTLGANATYWVRLQVHDCLSSALLSRNVYWLSTEEDVADWGSSTWYNTPYTAYANFQMLSSLPDLGPQLVATPIITSPTVISVTVNNTATLGSVAFMVRLRAVFSANTSVAVLPVLWSDNYVTLFSGDALTLTLDLSLTPSVAAEDVTVLVESWNSIVGGGRGPALSVAPP